MADTNIKGRTLKVDVAVLKKAFGLMATAREMSKLYEERKDICAKYVHATSKGHEAIQLAVALQLLPQDFVSPYYRDDSILLGIGYKPYDLMLQLLARKDDPFSGGRTYYSHPSSNRADRGLHGAAGERGLPVELSWAQTNSKGGPNPGRLVS